VSIILDEGSDGGPGAVAEGGGGGAGGGEGGGGGGGAGGSSGGGGRAGRTIFVGDVHGCAAELDELLRRLEYGAADRLLLTGDAFTRGPDPAGVWATIQRTGAEMVMGNHDRHMLEKLNKNPEHYDRKPKGDVATALAFSAELLPWLRALPYVIEDERFVLVHAGVNPEKGLAGTSEDDLVYLRTWPPNGTIIGKRWHEFYAPADDRVLVFGHDASGGLVEKRGPDGRPYLIGLDTGCAYGRSLTAWILEEDRLVSVPYGVLT
jgi:predicted phosphodiesterase